MALSVCEVIATVPLMSGEQRQSLVRQALSSLEAVYYRLFPPLPISITHP